MNGWQDYKILLNAAKTVSKSAYCPYSKLYVGCAALCEDGQICVGVNVENISYGLTMCAERSAIFNCISSGSIPKVLAIHAEDHQGNLKAIFPCGACRQVMSQFMDKYSAIYIDGIGEKRLGELLPNAFSGF